MHLENRQITYAPNVTRVGYSTIEFKTACDEIQSGKYREKITNLRMLNKEDYDAEKKRLPAYVFSGTFTGNKAINDTRDVASNLIICDLDHLGDIEAIKEKICALPFVACCFISPGGDGLKFCCHIDIEDISLYSHYHDALKTYLKQFEIVLDKGNDYARLCFVSYDPQIYINYDATLLELDIEKKYSKQKESKSQTLEEIRLVMTNWLTSTGRHDAIIKYSYMKVKDGANRAQAILDTEGFMCLTPENQRDEHWQSYYDDIEREVDGAIRQFAADRYEDAVDWSDIELEDIINEQYQYENMNIPLPPGRFGELVELCRSMSLYRYDCLSFITACGLLAGMGGRKFNVSNGGCNMYLTLLMPTGYGKEQVATVIKSLLTQLNTVGATAFDFLGEKNHTGPKSLIKSLSKKRCQVAIFTEKGIMDAIQSGDKAGLLKTILSVYVCSGENGHLTGEGYSNDNDNIKEIWSPSLTIIAESVPDSFLNGVKSKNAMTSGDIARQSVYMYDGDKPYEAEDVVTTIPSPMLKSKLIQIARLGQSVQNIERINGKVIKVILPDGYRKFSNEAIDIYNRNKDSTRGVAATRMAHKAYKYAALAAMINNDYEDEDIEIYVKDEDWAWARNIVMYEVEQSVRCLGEANLGSLFENLAINALFPTLITIEKELTAKEKKERLGIPCTMIRQRLKNNSKFLYRQSLRDITDGLEDVLEYCVNIGYLLIKESENNNARHVRKGSKYNANDRFFISNTFLSVCNVKEKGQKRV